MTMHESDDPSPIPAEALRCRPDEAIERLSHLLIGEITLDEMLHAVSALALIAVPAAGCAVTVANSAPQDAATPARVAGSTALAASLARGEIDLAHGPATEATTACEPVRSGGLSHEARWPRWSRRAAAVGMRSALATTLPGNDPRQVTLLWVSDVADRFDTVDEDAARRFAAAAGPTVRGAQIAEELRTSQESMRTALKSRATIDQAIGILMARGGGTPEDAWQRLRSVSQREHVKVAELARRTVEEATRRGRRGIPREGHAG